MKNNKKDPYGIPNTCFTLIDKKDNRWKKFKKQRVKQGFDESEFWDFEYTFCNWLLPRVDWYRKTVIKDIYPEELEHFDKLVYCLWYLANRSKIHNQVSKQELMELCLHDLITFECQQYIKEHIEDIFNMGW